MTDVSKKEDLVWRGIEIINQCVEQLDTWEDRHDAITQLRAHLEARAEQCQPPPDNSDLL